MGGGAAKHRPWDRTELGVLMAMEVGSWSLEGDGGVRRWASPLGCLSGFGSF